MNEIVTFGKGYKLNEGIKVFTKSSVNVPNTKVTVISLGLDLELIQYLRQHNIQVIDGEEIAKKHNVNLNISPYTLKVIFFRLYCKNYTNSKNLYFCDFTDVHFQPKDLFELVTTNKVYVSSEKNFIKNCETNKTWINVCYNADILKLLWNKEILNGGSILGRRDSCLYLLDEMCRDMGVILSRIGNYQNIDQASLNKCVYFDQHNFIILNNNQIFNCAHQSSASVTCKQNLYTLDNIEPYVIHQYDVIKQLEKDLYEK